MKRVHGWALSRINDLCWGAPGHRMWRPTENNDRLGRRGASGRTRDSGEDRSRVRCLITTCRSSQIFEMDDQVLMRSSGGT